MEHIFLVEDNLGLKCRGRRHNGPYYLLAFMLGLLFGGNFHINSNLRRSSVLDAQTHSGTIAYDRDSYQDDYHGRVSSRTSTESSPVVFAGPEASLRHLFSYTADIASLGTRPSSDQGMMAEGSGGLFSMSRFIRTSIENALNIPLFFRVQYWGSNALLRLRQRAGFSFGLQRAIVTTRSQQPSFAPTSLSPTTQPTLAPTTTNRESLTDR
jgi:hypothetical protein